MTAQKHPLRGPHGDWLCPMPLYVYEYVHEEATEPTGLLPGRPCQEELFLEMGTIQDIGDGMEVTSADDGQGYGGGWSVKCRGDHVLMVSQYDRAGNGEGEAFDPKILWDILETILKGTQ